MTDEFAMSLRIEKHSIILDLKGDLTKKAEQSILKSYNWQDGLEGGRRFLVLNFTEVPYINSTGIALLIRLVRFGKKGNFETFGYGLQAHYQKLFRMVGLTEYMLICPSEFNVQQRIEQYLGL